MEIVKCKGIKDKKHEGKIILKIIEGSRKGKIAFPIDFNPQIGQVYLCEIVYEKPNYCKVKLHKCNFIEDRTRPSIYISSSYVDIVFEIVKKCICGAKESKLVSKSIRREEEEDLDHFLERAKVETVKFLSSFNFDNKTIIEVIRKIEDYKNRLELEIKDSYIYIFNENEYKNLNKLAGEIIQKYNLVFPYITLLKKEGDSFEPKYLFKIANKEVEIQEIWVDSCGAYKKYFTNDIETAKEVLSILYGIFHGKEEYTRSDWKIESEYEFAIKTFDPEFYDSFKEVKFARRAFQQWYKTFRKYKKIVWFYYKIVIDDRIEVRVKVPFELTREDLRIEEYVSWEVEDPFWGTKDYEGGWCRYEPKSLELILEKVENATIQETLEYLNELAKKELVLGKFIYRVKLNC